MSNQSVLSGRTGIGANWILAFFIFLFGASAAIAQLPTATILGVVKDTSGAVVPGATLTARNTDTGQTRTTVSASDGSYRFPALLVGNYEVRAEQSGFQTEVRRGLTLTVTQEAVVNFTLQVGAVSQSVEVTAEAPQVNTTSGTIGALIGEQQVQDLPLNGRNYVDLTLLQPGVSRHQLSSPSATMFGEWFSTNGAGPRSNYFTLDGAPSGDAFGGNSASVAGTTLGVDGIREVRVITNSFSAEYGMRVGGQVVMVSKSGTNTWHGDGFEYLRNSVLDAANVFTRPETIGGKRIPLFQQNQFGGAAGGPIKHDKLFIFSNYEGLRIRLGLVESPRVPDPGCQFETPGGARVQAGDLIWNGAGTQPVGSVGNCPQLGGTTATTYKLSAVTQPLLALWSLPNVPGSDVYSFSPKQQITDNYGQARVDYTISGKDSMFIRFTGDHAYVVQPSPYPQFLTNLTSGTDLLTLSETHIFSPSLVGTFHASYSRNGFLGENAYTTDVTGPQYSFVAGKPIGTLTVGGLGDPQTAFGSANALPNDARINTFVYSADMFDSIGRHSLKFGALIEHQQLYTLGSGFYYGSITFSNLANFVQGIGTTQALSAIRADRIVHWNTYALYVQDDFRVVPRLTLNLGLRYEFNGNMNEVFNNGAALQNPLTDSAFTVGLPFKNPSLKNFGPRIGFAWDVFGDAKTSLRGGFAEMYDIGNVTYALIMSKGGQPPLLGLSSNNTPTTLGPLPLSFTAAQVGKTARTIDYNLRQTHMLTYNLTVERQLPSNFAVSVSYAGSRGLNLMSQKDVNATLPGSGSNSQPYGLCWLNSVAYPCANVTGLRPNPKWSTISVIGGFDDSWFNSLQVVAKKRFSKGLELSSAYTFERSIDDAPQLATGDRGGSLTTTSGIVPLSYDRGPADWEVRGALHLTAIYRLPAFSNLHGFTGTMANGWWVSSILTAQTGLPFTVYLSSQRSLNGEGAGTDRPNLVPGRSIYSITHGTSPGCGTQSTKGYVAPGTPLGTTGLSGLYYDPCAFSLQPQGTLGNEPRNFLNAPGVLNLDFSAVKDTKARFLGESGNIQFRAEIFNILNHPNFSRPSQSAYAGSTAAIPAIETPLGTAGTIIKTDTFSREIQFALKIIF
jgi:hypothetical protein